MTNLTIAQILQQAINHHRTGELPQAEQLYRTILQIEPNHPDANHNLGIIAVAMNKAELALPFFKLALESNSNQAQFWLSYIDALIKTKQFDLARAVLIQGKESYGLQGSIVDVLTTSLFDLYSVAIELRESGRYSEAIDWLKSYLVQNPQDAQAYAHLAHNFLLNQQDNDSWSAMNHALAINPASILVQRNHARLLLKQQKVIEARKIAAIVYQADPNDVENQVVFAFILVANNELEQAMILCESALQRQPNYAEAFIILGQANLKAGDKTTALQLFEKALSIKPYLVQFYPIVATLHKENQNLSASIKALQKALEYEPHQVNHMLYLGELLGQNYQVEEAILILEEAVKIAPKNANAWTNLGTALQQASELEKAKIAYEKALAINPKQAEILNNVGHISKSENNLDAALKYFEKALRLQPTRVTFMVSKAGVLIDLGRHKDAENILKQALEIEPQHYYAHFVLGGMFHDMGCLHESNACYLKVLEIKPDFEKAALGLTINHYLLSNDVATNEFLKRASPLLHRPKLEELKAGKIYVSYIGKLLNCWETEIKNTNVNFNDQNHSLPILAVIGESHSLAVHRTNFEIKQKQHRCQAHLLIGIKMWHLAQKKFHPMKQRVTQILNKLPCDVPIMFTIGEIDCRLDEGIWKTAKKKSKNYQDLVEKTVIGYLNWLENTLKNTGHQHVIIQGIPAPNYLVDENEDLKNDIATFIEMVGLVNERLMFHSISKGWSFLNIYAATALENGRSNEKWHLDFYHLKPSFYAQAHHWLKSA